MSSQIFVVYIVDPELADATYVYEPGPNAVTKLNRLALDAYAERTQYTVTPPAATNPSSPTDTQVLAGTLIPPASLADPGPASHVYTPAITTQAAAQSYVNSVSYLPSTTISIPIGGGTRGVIPHGTECYAVVLNHSKPANAISHSILNQSGPSPAIIRTVRRGKPENPSDPNTTDAQTGDNIEVCLIAASVLSGAGIASATALPYNTVNALPRFEFQPAAHYSWVYSQQYQIDSFDDSADTDPGGSTSNSVVATRALKPKAASNASFNCLIRVQNPTAAIFDPGLEVAVNNKTTNGNKVATDVTLVYQTLVPDVSPVNRSDITYAITVPSGHAVSENDELQFFLRVVGDSTNTRSFSISATTGSGQPPSGPPYTTIKVTAANIIVDQNVSVTLTLAADFGLVINTVELLGTVYQSDETTRIPNGFDAVLSVTDGVTVVGPVNAPIVSGDFAHSFTGLSLQFSSILQGISNFTRAIVSIVPTGGGSALAFFPRLRLSDPRVQRLADDTAYDGNATEGVPVIQTHISSTAGVVKAHVDISSQFGRIESVRPFNSNATYPNGLELVNALSTSNSVEFFGRIFDGPPPFPGSGRPIPPARIRVTYDLIGVASTFEDYNGAAYDSTLGAGLGGSWRNLTAGDVVRITLTDLVEAGNPIIPIDSGTPLGGTVDGQGRLSIIITNLMVSTGYVTGVPPNNATPTNGEDLLLEDDIIGIAGVTKFTFKGTILNTATNPIPDGSSLLIHNVTKNLRKIDRVGAPGGHLQGDYNVTFLAADFGLAPGSIVADVGDTIRYVLFEDLSPLLAAIDTPTYPDPAGPDSLVLPFTGGTLGAAIPVIPVPVGPPIIPAGISAVTGTLSSGEIQFAPGETPPRGEKTENFVGDFVPTVAEEIVVISKPIPTGSKIPTRALPYIDITVPTNTVGGTPFEFQLWLSNNANDAVPRWDEVTSLPDISDLPGRLLLPRSVNPLRLHIFTSTAHTALDYAVALKVRLRRNDATGQFSLNAWGVRWWNKN